MFDMATYAHVNPGTALNGHATFRERDFIHVWPKPYRAVGLEDHFAGGAAQTGTLSLEG